MLFYISLLGKISVSDSTQALMRKCDIGNSQIAGGSVNWRKNHFGEKVRFRQSIIKKHTRLKVKENLKQNTHLKIVNKIIPELDST